MNATLHAPWDSAPTTASHAAKVTTANDMCLRRLVWLVWRVIAGSMNWNNCLAKGKGTGMFKAGDAVTWRCYGQTKRGTIVEEPRGNVAIIREHDTWRRTWAALESLSKVKG